MSAFWGYPPPPHYYPYYWFILDPKSKQDKVKLTNLKNLPNFYRVDTILSTDRQGETSITPFKLRWAGGNKTVLVSTLEYLKVPGQDAFTKPACINTMIYRICYQIFVTYVISNTVWNKVRHPPWLVRSVAKDHIMNASYTRWMCLRRRLMPLAHRKLQLDWTPLDYLVYITCVVPVNLAPDITQGSRHGEEEIYSTHWNQGRQSANTKNRGWATRGRINHKHWRPQQSATTNNSGLSNPLTIRASWGR